MRLFLPILIIAFTFSSCQDREAVSTNLQNQYDSVRPSSSVTNSDETNLANEDFYSFWKRFRQAVINSDTSQVVSMTRFPFKTRGPLDHFPIMDYSREKFIPVFNALLNQRGEEMDGTTVLDDIKKIETPGDFYISEDNAQVGNLVFEKTIDGWKLVFAYLYAPTIESLQE